LAIISLSFRHTFRYYATPLRFHYCRFSPIAYLLRHFTDVFFAIYAAIREQSAARRHAGFGAADAALLPSAAVHYFA
jgi:hypothetical protein